MGHPRSWIRNGNQRLGHPALNTVDLRAGIKAWQSILGDLATGSTVKTAVANANTYIKTIGYSYQWIYIGDGNVTIGPKTAVQ